MIIKMKRKMRSMALWQKLLWIAIVMALIRVGTVIPIPWVNQLYMQLMLGTGANFLQTMMGGSLSSMSLFALSISPYITASIILQLLTVLIPPLARLQKDGESGMKRYRKIEAITGAVLGIAQAAAMAVGFGSQGLLDPYNWKTVLATTAIWSAGAIILIIVGQFLDNFQLGSGISMILFCNIVSSIPTDCVSLYRQYIKGQPRLHQAAYAGIIGLVFLAMVGACVWLAMGVKKVPVRNSSKVAGQSPREEIPIPLLTCNVMPYIFASSIMTLPYYVSRFAAKLQSGWTGKVVTALQSNSWFLPNHPLRCLGAVIFCLLTYFFTIYYLDFAFNAREISDGLKHQGAYIPGIRPGAPTENYLRDVIKRVAVRGNAGMMVLIMAITALCNNLSLALSISGTSLIIAVTVLYDLMRRIRAERKEARTMKSLRVRSMVPELKTKKITRWGKKGAKAYAA